ncbi:UNVERIFIED_CONTAM: hypothetical protein Sangu_0461600 [Sesamum angustifolium]|uniref:Aminotransferase-like plant mobile domain-containing protein n=1 Tax=Sesamum angustifolium TaxID=2727405 RepID=A0AAW2QTX8_9LAMI
MWRRNVLGVRNTAIISSETFKNNAQEDQDSDQSISEEEVGLEDEWRGNAISFGGAGDNKGVMQVMSQLELLRGSYELHSTEKEAVSCHERKVGCHIDDEVEDPLFNDGDETNLDARITSATHTLSNERIVYLPTMASVSDSDEEIVSDDEKIHPPALRSVRENVGGTCSASQEVETLIRLNENPSCSSSHGAGHGTKAKPKFLFRLHSRISKPDEVSAVADCFQERSDLPLESPEPENPQSLKSMIPRRTMADQFHEAFGTVSTIDERPHLAFLNRSGSSGIYGKLQQVMLSEKEKDMDYLKNISAGISSKDDRMYISVRILSRSLEAKLIVCSCTPVGEGKKSYWEDSLRMRMKGVARTLTIIFNPRICSDVELEVGSLILIHPPWYELDKLKSSLVEAFLSTYDSDNKCFILDKAISLYLGLEHVYHISGLLVDGNPIICGDMNVKRLCAELLGVDSENGRIKSEVSFKWLEEHFEEVRECIGEDDPDLERYIRAYLLFLIGTVILLRCDVKMACFYFLSLHRALWQKNMETLSPLSFHEAYLRAWGLCFSCILNDVMYFEFRIHVTANLQFLNQVFGIWGRHTEKAL